MEFCKKVFGSVRTGCNSATVAKRGLTNATALGQSKEGVYVKSDIRMRKDGNTSFQGNRCKKISANASRLKVIVSAKVF